MSFFYYGAGDLFDPSSGMDVVLREHVLECLEHPPYPQLRIVTLEPQWDRPPALPGEGHCFFASDFKRSRSGLSSLLFKLGHVLRGKPLMNIGFPSLAARKQFKRDMRAGGGLFVVDHLMTMANISLVRLIFSRSKVIYICHNFTPRTMIDAAYAKRSRLKKLVLYAQALQIWLLESIVIWKSVKTFFISENDRQKYEWISGGRAEVVTPALQYKKDETLGDDRFADQDLSDCVVFVGSPGFPPNKFALEWIVQKLAPALMRANVPVRLLLVGKGTERYRSADGSNIVPAGFVSEKELASILSRALCSLSPVIHGSGLKIKLLEAFHFRCPVIASKESLRGFEFMGEMPVLDIGDPDRVALQIADLMAGCAPESLSREHIAAVWNRHLASRHGQLKQRIGAQLSAGAHAT